MTFYPNVVNVQQQDCAQREKKTFPPDELVNKQAGELPEGVDPAEREVSVSPRHQEELLSCFYGLYVVQMFQIEISFAIKKYLLNN